MEGEDEEVCACAVVLVLAGAAGMAAPIQLWAPWTKGETWSNQGYFYTPPSHRGVDFSHVGGGSTGRPILAAADGTVSKIAWDATGFGWYVKIDHAADCQTLYGHLNSDPRVDPGICEGLGVAHGKVIGKCGNTPGPAPSWSYGAHLHFELRQNGTAIFPSPISGVDLTDGVAITSDNEEGGGSDVWPVAPTNLSPGLENPIVPLGGNVTFTWDDHPMSDGQPRFRTRVQVVNLATPDQAVNWCPDLRDDVHSSVWTPTERGHYKWRVYAEAQNGHQAWSDDPTRGGDPVAGNGYFTVGGWPVAPTNLSPGAENPTIPLGRTVHFTWTDHPMTDGQPRVQTVVQVVNLARPDEAIPWTPVIVGDDHFSDWTPTEPGSYKWRVWASDGCNDYRHRAWSDDPAHGGDPVTGNGYFTVAEPTPTAPTNLSPGAENPTTTLGGTVHFTWTDHPMSNGTPRHQNSVEIRRLPSNEVVDWHPHPGDDAHFSDWTPDRPGEYVWRVSADNSDGLQAWSDDPLTGGDAVHGIGYFTVVAAPPTVVSWAPKSSSAGLRAVVVACFSTRMRQVSVQNCFVLAPDVTGAAPIAGTFSWVGRKMTFTPSAPLSWGTTYRVKIKGGAKSNAGIMMGRLFTWTFTTRPASSGAALLTASAAGTAQGAQVTVHLTAAARVQVQVLNLAGRPVAVLAEQACEAGTTTLLWNGRAAQGTAVPGGTYLVRVTARGAEGSQAQALASCSLRR